MAVHLLCRCRRRVPEPLRHNQGVDPGTATAEQPTAHPETGLRSALDLPEVQAAKPQVNESVEPNVDNERLPDR